MTKIRIVYPIRTSEFRVTYRGQHAPQQPVIEIVAVHATTHTHEMYATYDPFIGGGYDPSAWFIRMPRGIKMNEIRAIMRAILPAVIGHIVASTYSNLSALITAAETLSDTVNVAIRNEGYDSVGNGNYVKETNNV